MVCDPDLLEQIELSLENVRQVRKVRQQLMASLNELQKCEEDVFNSLNKVGDRLRRNMLQFQGRGVSGERVGDVVAVDGEINHGHVNSITVTTVSSGRGESTSVAAGSRESGTSCTTSVSENSYAGMTRRAAYQTSVRGSAAVRRPMSSVSEQPAKKMKFHRRSGTVLIYF